jgi:hypothetical protein
MNETKTFFHHPSIEFKSSNLWSIDNVLSIYLIAPIHVSRKGKPCSKPRNSSTGHQLFHEILR